ncbi:hypothetical protein PGT21_006950 [Puccinia graminis f. sp. tritici]|uniref:RING-type domain-containing protein n=1 Tax=Puccinia graminis f. sp. tritici TaxID=56615 RepID=A0A5B0QZU4_PUCGR|nr:hypothetical protein PGT21_006950 [Puccinia graminis f. sp. tritici]
MLFQSTSIKILPYFLIIMLVARYSEMKVSERSTQLPESLKEMDVHLEPNLNHQKEESTDSLGIYTHDRLVRRSFSEETCKICKQPINPYTGPLSKVGCNHRFHIECLRFTKAKDCPVCSHKPEDWIQRKHELRLQEEAKRFQPEDYFCSKTVVFFWVVAFIPALVAMIYSDPPQIN